LLVQLLHTYKQERIAFPDPIGTYTSQGMLKEDSKKNQKAVKTTMQSIHSYMVKQARHITLNRRLNVRNGFFFYKPTSNWNF